MNHNYTPQDVHRLIGISEAIRFGRVSKTASSLAWRFSIFTGVKKFEQQNKRLEVSWRHLWHGNTQWIGNDI